jgi:isoquinoline 1-oxidoreductase alpha subunit
MPENLMSIVDKVNPQLPHIPAIGRFLDESTPKLLNHEASWFVTRRDSPFPASDTTLPPIEFRLWERRRRMAVLTINGKRYDAAADPETPLLWVLRDTLGLTGTKYGCGIAQCGSCTVHIDGVPTRSCSVQLGSVGDGKITTIEGLAANGMLHKVQNAWLDNDVPQCGYCQSGMIMAAAALLAEKPNPTDDDIDAAMTNICRCGTYQQVRAAIHAAAKA